MVARGKRNSLGFHIVVFFITFLGNIKPSSFDFVKANILRVGICSDVLKWRPTFTDWSKIIGAPIWETSSKWSKKGE